MISLQQVEVKMLDLWVSYLKWVGLESSTSFSKKKPGGGMISLQQVEMEMLDLCASYLKMGMARISSIYLNLYSMTKIIVRTCNIKLKLL